MAVLSEAKVNKLANLFECVPEALERRVTEPLVAGHIACLTEIVFKGQDKPSG